MKISDTSVSQERADQKVRRTAIEIQAIIEQYEKSGMAASDFCRIHKIRKSYFSKWLSRYSKKGSANGFVAVSLATTEPAPRQQHSLFAEYRGIKFYQKVDASYLKSLLN